MARRLVVEIVGDASSLERTLKGASKTFSGSVAQWAKGAIVFQGVQKAQELLGAAVHSGISEWSESTKVAAQTAAVLKSTGGQAGVTAKQVDTLATALMRKSGIDDEAIKSSENLLLTFRSIHNQAGKNNDIFNQATRATLDLSVAMHKDLGSSSILVGKALNDPIKGMTALRRVGVQLTDAQVAQVKAMVKTGDTMGAQKVILAELTKEFGGSAEAAGKTLPGQLSIARESFKNFAGDLVGRSVPAIQSAITALRNHWPEIQAVLKKFWAAISPILTDLKNILVEVAAVVRDNWPTISKVFQQAWSVWKPLFAALHGALKLIVDLLKGDWGAAWNDAKTVVSNLVTAIKNLLGAAVTDIYAAAKAIGTKIKEALLEGVGTVGDWFHNHVIQPVLNKLSGFPGEVSDFGKALFNKFTGFFAGAGIAGWVSNRATEWAGFIAAIPSRIADFGRTLFNTVTGFIANAQIGTWISNKISDFAGFFAALPGRVAEAVKGKASDLWDGVKHIFDKLPGFIKDALGISSPSKVFMEIGEAIVQGAIKGIQNKAGDLLSAAKVAFGGAVGAVGGAIVGSKEQRTSVNANIELGQKMAASYGWTGGQWQQLLMLWNRESGWNTLARNPKSGAFGIPQALPPSKMPVAAQRGDAASQIAWGLSYIKSRYGSPAAAWAHELALGWYDRGGILKPGLTLAYNATGHEETVLPLPPGKLGGGATYVFNFPNYVGDKTELVAMLRREAKIFANRNARSAFA